MNPESRRKSKPEPEPKPKLSSKAGPEGKDSVMTRKVVMRSEDGTASFTPLQGKYLYLWNITLQRRLTEGKDPFFEPDDSEGSRARFCGLTVTHVVLPMQRVKQVLESFYPGYKDDEALRKALQSTERSRHPDNWSADWSSNGISKLKGDKCRIVINKAVARSPTDGLLLGENCYSFYGANIQVDSSRFSGNMLHASPLAVKIVVWTLMEDHYQAFIHARQSASMLKDGAAPAVRDKVWRKLQYEISGFMYYMWTMAPYHRGAPTTGLMLHHAFWLSIFPVSKRGMAILCIPQLGMEMYTDWEAMSVDVEYFQEEIWWNLFDGKASRMLRCLDGVLKQPAPNVQEESEGNGVDVPPQTKSDKASNDAPLEKTLQVQGLLKKLKEVYVPDASKNEESPAISTTDQPDTDTEGAASDTKCGKALEEALREQGVAKAEEVASKVEAKSLRVKLALLNLKVKGLEKQATDRHGEL